jgi:lambda repressor-like predicted transcriptional regulator
VLLAALLPLSHGDVVDLMGRLSNPPETLDSVPEQGGWAPPPPRWTTSKVPKRPVGLPEPGDPEEKGRLSNPVLRRLIADEIDELAGLYREGATIDALGRRYGVHRTTIIHHLDRQGVPRRRVVRKMTDSLVAQASKRYARGLSLVDVAAEYGVHERTLAREFRRGGIPIRLRRGWGG